MGAKTSKDDQTEKVLKKSKRNVISDSRTVRAFERISDGQPILSFQHFTKAFGNDLGSSLWNYLSSNASEKTYMDLEMFNHHFSSLVESSDTIVEMLMPLEILLRTCAYCADIPITQKDENFMNSITSELVDDKPLEIILQWKKTICPRICDTVITRINNIFFGDIYKTLPFQLESDILTPFQCWFLQCCLSDIYVSNAKIRTDKSPLVWTKLYSSSEHGMSGTKFEQMVFNYRAPTVTIIRMCTGNVYALALDQEWRNSGNMFGSVDCTSFELSPCFKKSVQASSVYCNLRLRNYAQKLSCKDFFSVDQNLNGVDALETFGCGNVDVLNEKLTMNERYKQQAERNKKVPLPSKWEENADKMLLELAGVYSTENRRKVFERE